MRCVIALSVALALITLSPIAASAKGGRVSLYGPWDQPSQSPPVARASMLPLPSVSVHDLLSACGRGRYRDPTTHRCRGPADVR